MGGFLRSTAVLLVPIASAVAAADAAAALPDLGVRVTRGPTAALPGARFVARDVTVNRGRGRAGRSTTGYYLSRDAQRGRGDVRLGRRAVKALRAHGSSNARKRLRLPASVAPGRYRLLACADVGARIRERSERNNCRSARLEVVTPRPPPPPLPATPPAPADSTPPVPSLDNPAAWSASDDATPAFDGGAGTGPGDSTSVTVRVWRGAAAAGDPVSTLVAATGPTGRWAVVQDPALEQGVYTAQAEQADTAGNRGVSDAHTFTIGPATLLAAGDIASCSSDGDEQTASLLEELPAATVAALGDNAYDAGTRAEYDACYDPTWGIAKARTRPVPGNHEYNSLEPGAAGYFGYFGPLAGDTGAGYYSYDLGAWHVVALNSMCAQAGGCYAGSPQERWLRADLAAHPARCTLAYLHHPLFTSDASAGRATNTKPLWDALYEAGAEIVLTAHAHNYERFAPQTPGGSLDSRRGIREFVSGTGGKSLSSFASSPAPHSEARENMAFGVLELTLAGDRYDWRFAPVAGSSYADAGGAACH